MQNTKDLIVTNGNLCYTPSGLTVRFLCRAEKRNLMGRKAHKDMLGGQGFKQRGNLELKNIYHVKPAM